MLDLKYNNQIIILWLVIAAFLITIFVCCWTELAIVHKRFRKQHGGRGAQKREKSARNVSIFLYFKHLSDDISGCCVPRKSGSRFVIVNLYNFEISFMLLIKTVDYYFTSKKQLTSVSLTTRMLWVTDRIIFCHEANVFQCENVNML